MQELFYEETVLVQNPERQKKFHNIFKIISMTMYILLAIWVLIIYIFPLIDKQNVLSTVLAILFPALFFTTMGIVCGIIKNKFYVEYDYTFISGSIRIAKIICNTKRKLLYNFDVKTIEQIGKYDSETFKKYQKTPGIKLQYLTSNNTPAEDKDFYYIVAHVNGHKRLLVLECKRTFILALVKFTGITVLERNFK